MHPHTKPDPGGTCPFCKNGVLQARTRTGASAKQDIIGVHTLSVTILQEVVCGSCGIKFEPRLVNQNVKELLEEQVHTYKKPNERPSSCPKCRRTDFITSRLSGTLEFLKSTDLLMHPVHKRNAADHHYEYCKYCLLVVWDTPPESSIEPQPSIAQRPMHHDYALKPSVRGSATPIPSPKPIRRKPPP